MKTATVRLPFSLILYILSVNYNSRLPFIQFVLNFSKQSMNILQLMRLESANHFKLLTV